jgi:uncharacterized protein
MKSGSLTRDPLYRDLLTTIRGYGSVVVAYSGGVDSTLVVKASAAALGDDNVLAVTGVSASLAPREREGASHVLREIGLEQCHRLLETSEQEKPEYKANQPDRCFHCKTELYTRLRALAKTEGYATIANGANLDDLEDFRPGMAAADDFTVQSPLVDARLTKDDVRRIARALALPNWNKPAAPCLASRVPHGLAVSPEILDQVARAEAYLQDLGLSDFRVRHHGDVARIELNEKSWTFFKDPRRRLETEAAFLEFGFRFVALDLGGYRQGKAVIR